MRVGPISLFLKIPSPGLLCVQENQKRLFKEVIQISPDVLQNGNGSGFGLWSEYPY